MWPRFQEYFLAYDDVGFSLDIGTRTALYEGGRESMTLSMPEVNPFTVGALIALYERAVGFYGSLVRINAYHQPGVEAGKKAATEVLALQARVHDSLGKTPGETAEDLAQRLGAEPEAVFHVLRQVAVNDPGVGSSNSEQPAAGKFFRRR